MMTDTEYETFQLLCDDVSERIDPARRDLSSISYSNALSAFAVDGEYCAVTVLAGYKDKGSRVVFDQGYGAPLPQWWILFIRWFTNGTKDETGRRVRLLRFSRGLSLRDVQRLEIMALWYQIEYLTRVTMVFNFFVGQPDGTRWLTDLARCLEQSYRTENEKSVVKRASIFLGYLQAPCTTDELDRYATMGMARFEFAWRNLVALRNIQAQR
jgi:hypothetical protein